MEWFEKENTTLNKDVGSDEFSWRYFLRQVFIASSSWVLFFCMGMFIGSPTVIISQMRREANSTTAVSEETASWLSSTFYYSAIPWVFIFPYVSRIYERKKTAIAISLISVISFTVFLFSITTTLILIAEGLIGVTNAGIVTVNIIIISEYTSPKYRGLLLTLKSASLLWGIWISNAIGTYSSWKNIPLVGLICSLYSLMVCFWPESPRWLASKQRFTETRKIHRWLKGTDQNSESELEQMIKSPNENELEYSLTNFKIIFKKEFYLPLLIAIASVFQHHFSGKLVFTIYALDIMKRIMNSESAAYRSMLILDGCTVVSTYIGCVFVKFFKRRTVLLISSSIAIMFLFNLALYLYLIKLSLIDENVYCSIVLLGGFSMSISCGPMIMSTTLYGELIPLKYQSISIIIISLVFFLTHGTLLKISPIIFNTFSMPGTFLFYGVCSLVCAVVMYKYLPETKDKTLLEIEQYFKEVSSQESRKLMKHPS